MASNPIYDDLKRNSVSVNAISEGYFSNLHIFDNNN